MAVLTVHHWPDLDAGLAEMRRVARRSHRARQPSTRSRCASLWFVRDYFPAIVGLHADRISSAALAAKLPAASLEPIPVPRDCADLFFAALWARPEMVLDPEVRAADVGLAAPARGGPAARASSGSPPTSSPAPGRQRNGAPARARGARRRPATDRLQLGGCTGAGRMARRWSLTTRLEGSIVVLEPLTRGARRGALGGGAGPGDLGLAGPI